MKAEVEVSEGFLRVELTDFKNKTGHSQTHIGEVIIQARKGKHDVWFISHDKVLATADPDTEIQSVYGHITAEDARILGETLIKATEIAEGKL